MPSTLRIGSRVSGCVGPFLPICHTASTNESGKRPRRHRQRFYGVIIASVAERTWKVLWNETGQATDTKAQVLRLESNSGLTESDLSALRERHQDIRAPSLSQQSQQSSVTSLAAGHTSSLEAAEETTPAVLLAQLTPAADENDGQERQEEEKEETENNNTQDTGGTSIDLMANRRANQLPATQDLSSSDESDADDVEPSIQEEQLDNLPDEDFRLQRDDTTTGVVYPNLDAEGHDPVHVHLQRVMMYKTAKENMVGNKVAVGPRNGPKVEWIVRDDIAEKDIKEPPPPETPSKVGIIGFDFGKRKETQDRLDLLSLLIHLWPGDWKEQLQNINDAITKHNEQANGTADSRHKRRRVTLPSGQYKRNRTIRKVTEQEFWIFFGLLLFARLFGRVGDIWDRDSKKREGYRPTVDASRHMSEYRFAQIRHFVPMMWADESKKDTDDWWQIQKLFDDFNINRTSTVSPCDDHVLDEFMSAFKPQTRSTGNLPHISFVMRKPEPLGTEGKVRADPLLKIFTWVELQRGKMPMRAAEFSQEFGGTTACVLRLCKSIGPRQLENTELSDFPFAKRIRVFGDSWFASVKTAVALWKLYGILFVGVVKTAHAKYPKAFLEDKMKDWPAGSHLVLESKIDDVEVVAIGYKYNARKVICFVCHKDAGDTEITDHYEAKWKDFNNTMSRIVPRPTVVGDYFRSSNTIDCHNEMRQFFLKLEKHWITTDGFFRIITTFFGICITDAWNAYKHHIGKNHRHRDVSIIDFADMLLQDLLENTFSNVLAKDAILHIPLQRNDGTVSELTPPSTAGTTATIRASAVTTSSTREHLSRSFADASRALDAAAAAAPSATHITEDSPCQHGDVKPSDNVYHVNDEKKGRTYKRKRRGKCHVCGKHTAFYCLKCDQIAAADASKTRRWLCGSNTGRDCIREHCSMF